MNIAGALLTFSRDGISSVVKLFGADFVGIAFWDWSQKSLMSRFLSSRNVIRFPTYESTLCEVIRHINTCKA